VDEGRRTSILKWKKLRDPIDEVQKIEQEFIKIVPTVQDLAM
jgi:hypothetical protein